MENLKQVIDGVGLPRFGRRHAEARQVKAALGRVMEPRPDHLGGSLFEEAPAAPATLRQCGDVVRVAADRMPDSLWALENQSVAPLVAALKPHADALPELLLAIEARLVGCHNLDTQGCSDPERAAFDEQNGELAQQIAAEAIWERQRRTGNSTSDVEGVINYALATLRHGYATYYADEGPGLDHLLKARATVEGMLAEKYLEIDALPLAEEMVVRRLASLNGYLTLTDVRRARDEAFAWIRRNSDVTQNAFQTVDPNVVNQGAKGVSEPMKGPLTAFRDILSRAQVSRTEEGLRAALLQLRESHPPVVHDNVLDAFRLRQEGKTLDSLGGSLRTRGTGERFF